MSMSLIQLSLAKRQLACRRRLLQRVGLLKLLAVEEAATLTMMRYKLGWTPYGGNGSRTLQDERDDPVRSAGHVEMRGLGDCSWTFSGAMFDLWRSTEPYDHFMTANSLYKRETSESESEPCSFERQAIPLSKRRWPFVTRFCIKLPTMCLGATTLTYSWCIDL